MHWRLNQNKEKDSLFLVWSGDLREKPIKNIFYEYKRVDVQNKEYVVTERIPVHYDQDSRLWFIPLHLELGKRQFEIDPTDVHWFPLEIHVNGSSILRVKVGIRIFIPPPDLSAKVLPLKTKIYSAKSLNIKLNSGISFLKEELVNTSPRRLKFWFQQNSKFDLINYLSNQTYRGRRNAPPVSEVSRYFSKFSFNKTYLDLFFYSLKGGFLGKKRVDNLAGKINTFELDPYQRVYLEWGAYLEKKDIKCRVPKSKVKRFSWQERVLHRIGGPEPGEWEQIISHNSSRKETWKLEGSRFHLNFNHQIFVSDVFLNDLDSSSIRVNKVLKKKYSKKLSFGKITRNINKKYSCQGAFLF